MCARRARRNACAPAASTTISTASATPPATTPSSKCWGTFRSAITSRKRPSSSPGTSSRATSRSPRIACLSPSIPRTRTLCACGRRSPAFPTGESCASRPPTISGRWARPALAAPARKSSMTTASISRAARRGAPRPKATATSKSGTSSSCSTSSCPAAGARTFPGPPSIPAWGWSASPRSCRACTTITTSISSAASSSLRPKPRAPRPRAPMR